MTILPLPYQFEYLLLLFLIWYLWLSLPILCWREVVRLGLLVLFKILSGRLSAFPCWVLYWLQVCHKWLLLCWDMFPLYLLWLRVFIMNGCSILSKDFSASIEMIMWSLSFLLFMWCVTLINLHMLNHPCELGMNPIWLWCMIFFMCCCIQFANTLLRIFASTFIKDTGL